MTAFIGERVSQYRIVQLIVDQEASEYYQPIPYSFFFQMGLPVCHEQSGRIELLLENSSSRAETTFADHITP